METASHAAVRDRRPVVVDPLTTATAETTAQPDGTFTLDEHAHPVRVRSGDGWVPVDTTLRSSAAGVATGATTLPLSLGAGGDTRLATLTAGGGSLTLTWPTALPAPRLSGSTATYPGVFPGVDLRVTAADSGFSEQLVVSTRQAAANPALRHVAFGVRAGGLTLRGSPDGGLTVLDAHGTAVLRADPARMWDATGTGPRDAPTGHGAAVATAAGPDSITLSPDLSFLNAPGTAYPVTIDPDFHPNQTVWDKVFSGFPTQTYVNGGIDGAQAKVGACYVASGECNGLGVARSYFQFDLSSLHSNGGLVKAAEFNVDETFGSSCTAKPIELESTGGISSATDWNNQPTGKVIGTIDMGCAVQAFGYNIFGLWNGGPVTAPTLTLMLRAGDESDQLAWRKFTDNPSLVITYNRRPSAPTSLTTAGRACATTSGAQVLNPETQANGVRTVALGAKASDPDGQNVKLTFTWFSGSTQLGTLTSPFIASGTGFTAQIPANQLTDGRVISWRASTSDGQDVSGNSATCFFTVDETAPAVPPSVTSTDYPGTTDPTCPVAFTGGVGQTGTFTFGPNGTGTSTTTTSDIAGYFYGLAGTPALLAATATPGGSVSVPVTPTKFGPNLLTVFSVDKANNKSTSTTYCFRVLPGKEAVHHWSLDGAIGQAGALDEPGDGVTALDAGMVGLGAGGLWTAGQIGEAALFNGSLNDYVQQTTAGKAIDTSKSFSVSAWVRLDKLGNYPTAVSVDGVHAPGFQLQAQPDGHWAFVMFESDSDGGGFNYRLVSNATVAVGQWTQLIGSYDAGTHQMSLYVNGVLDRTLAHTSTWSASGPLTIGRSMFDGAKSDPFTGAIDDVRLFDHAMEPSGDLSDDTLTNAANLASLPLRPYAWYNVEEGTGPVAEDVTGNWNPATISGGATRVDAADPDLGTGKSALQLDGATGFAATTAPVVRTDLSFTVSARVNLADLGDSPMTILSEDGAQTSNFALQYRDDGGTPSFAVQLAGSDVAAPTENLVTGGEPDIGVWTDVAATYNAATGDLRLYVGGQLVGQSATKVAKNWAATGPLEIGRGRAAGTAAQYFAGRIDEVHAYAGAETAPQVADDSATPVPAPVTPYAGEVTRWESMFSSAHISSTSGAVPGGFGFEGPEGALAPAGAPDTSRLYACLYNGNDEFTSNDPGCEGTTVLGPIGSVYNSPSDTPGAVALYRCEWVSGSTFHFDSTQSNCEGKTVDFRIGYLRPLSPLVRYVATDTGQSWTSAVGGLPTGFLPQDDLGVRGGRAVISLAATSGTTTLMMCQNAAGEYLATDVTCGGDTVLAGDGFIWTSQPGGAPSAQLYSCVAATTGQRFASMDPGCEGRSTTAPTVLGWVETQL